MNLLNLFPNLTDENHEVTSPRTIKYNCIAWVKGAGAMHLKNLEASSSGHKKIPIATNPQTAAVQTVTAA